MKELVVLTGEREEKQKRKRENRGHDSPLAHPFSLSNGCRTYRGVIAGYIETPSRTRHYSIFNIAVRQSLYRRKTRRSQSRSAWIR